MKKVFWFILAFFAIAISFQPLLYFSAEMRNGGLLSMKPAELLADFLYMVPFYAHITLGGVALLTGWPQFNRNWRSKSVNFHRNLGKIYITAVLISGIAGLIIAFRATGGPVTQTGFGLLGALWLFTTLKGYLSIINKKTDSHENWMIRSYALCFAAVTLRLWIPFFMVVMGYEFLESYKIIAWLAWIPNLMVAEILIYSKSGKRVLVKA